MICYTVHMKRNYLVAGGIVAIIAAVLLGVYVWSSRDSQTPSSAPSSQINEPVVVTDETRMMTLINEFGKKLQTVSLLDEEGAPDTLSREYGPFITEALLTEWRADLGKALGKRTSSPWPDRILVRTIQRLNKDSYEVAGDIVLVTNEGGGIGEDPTEADRMPVTFLVVREGEGWKIGRATTSASPSEGDWMRSAPTSQGVTFLYPNPLPTTYITPQKWPPLVEVTAGGTFLCEEGTITAAGEPLKTRVRRTVGDREYCIVTSIEGAAGSSYMNYEYTTLQGNFMVRVVFILRTPQCANYDEPKQGACKAEEQSFDVDGLVDRIVSSVTMP